MNGFFTCELRVRWGCQAGVGQTWYIAGLSGAYTLMSPQTIDYLDDVDRFEVLDRLIQKERVVRNIRRNGIL